jgi:hypothetical protein
MISGRQISMALGAAGAIVISLVVGRQEAVVPAADTSAPRPSARSTRGESAVPDVRLESLDAAPTDPGASDRNPFRFSARAETAPPDDSLPPDVAPEPPPLPPRPPAGPPSPPPIQLRFIGLFDAPSQSVRVAILSDGRGNVFHGKEGDIIEGRYRVLSVGTDAVELSYLDGRGRQTLRLSGQ